MRQQEQGGAGRGPYATGDPRMLVWIALIGAGAATRGALYVALAYGVAYVGWPIVRAARRREVLVRGSPRVAAATLAALAAVGAAAGAVLHAGAAWWGAVAAALVAAAAPSLAARRPAG